MAWVKANVPVDGVFAADTWNEYPPSVFFIDHDETKVGIGQKKRRTSAYHNGHLVRCHCGPGSGALAR